jgi:hypothetical protein
MRISQSVAALIETTLRGRSMAARARRDRRGLSAVQ